MVRGKLYDRLVCALLVTWVAGCGGSAPQGPLAGKPPEMTAEQRERATGFGSLGLKVRIESSVSPDLRALIQSDYILLSQSKLAGGAVFRSVFGGPGNESVLRYLDERIQYVIGRQSDAELDHRFSQLGTDALGGRVMASNLSLPAWVRVAQNPALGGFFRFDSEPVPVRGTRTGIMMFGEGYSPAFPDIGRVATLVHEARHSDCPAGLPADFLRTSDISRLGGCGQAHVACPPSHALAGLPACDAQPWGAYSMGLLYLATLQASCVDCSEKVRAEATIQAIDAASRILMDPDDMFSGKFGQPNMANIPQIIGGNH